MIYFVTFNEKIENSNIIQLNNKYSMIEFCKTHPNDIICYINKNSVIINDSDILNKYYQLKTPLVFANDFTNILEKYIHEKTEPYDPCYIGTSKSIIDYYYGKYNIVYDTTIFHRQKTNTTSIVSYLPSKSNMLFLPEIILFIILCILLYFNQTIISYLSCIIIVFVFIEYELKIKHFDISIQHKILCLLIDLFHVFVQFFLLFLIINFNCNVKKLVFLNIMYLTVVFLFFIFKSCILSILQNILSKETTVWTGIDFRINYFFNSNKPYVIDTIYTDDRRMHSWISGNKLFILALIALNTYFFVKCKM